MFHWICPECGREIAPQAKECSACDPSAVAAAPMVEAVETPLSQVVEAPAAERTETPTAKFEVKPEPLLLAAPQPVAVAPAPLQPLISGAPKPPASAIPLPITVEGANLSPVAAAPLAFSQSPVWQKTIPPPEPARGPRISCAPLREPQPAAPADTAKSRPQIAAGPEFSAAPTALPSPAAPPVPAPPVGALSDYTSIAAARIKPARGNTKPAGSAVKEHLSLPGPTLPHELTSLDAAGIAKILVASGRQSSAAKSSSWFLSFVVAAAVLAGTLAATFYAMPGLANSDSAPKAEVAKAEPAPKLVEPVVPVNPLIGLVEVTGIRFVTDVPGQRPQIHYLVVNHSKTPLSGLTVNVTLRAGEGTAQAPLSQFSFKTNRLGAYEAKEMVSSIERINRPVTLPDWRDLRAEIQITQ